MSGFELSPGDWDDFRGALDRVRLRLAHDSELRDEDECKPGCNDDEVGLVDGVDARTIVSRFWSTMDLDTLHAYVNPLNWPDLSKYWKSMTPVAGTAGPGLDSYDATFREVVALPTGEVTAYLAVSYRRTADYVMTRYCETTTPYNPDVHIDRGWVLATNVTVSPPGLKSKRSTLVQATKTIEFREQLLNEFTGLACDNGWVDLMIAMARESDLKKPSNSAKTTAGSPPADPLEQLRRLAYATVDQQIGITRRGITALRQGTLDREVEKDLYELCDRYVDVTTAGAKVSRGLVAELGKGRDKT